ncbi:MAG TPA: hypothetical protein VM689_04890 [Aliidongia sp.]|nr:hypothetical protein [Aliidongia sp.]
MGIHEFDDSNIVWRTVDGLENAAYHIYDVDEKGGIVDVIFKFAANRQVMLHRHRSPYRTLVIQGELRIYRANGELKEIRPTGSYVSTQAGGEPHRECGGDQEAIVFFSNRQIEDAVYEFLDDDLNSVMTLGLADFRALFDAQGR